MLTSEIPQPGRAAFADGPIRDMIDSAIHRASGEIAALRNDSRESEINVTLGRALIRDYVRHVGQGSQRSGRCDAKDVETNTNPVMAAVAKGLGYVTHGNRIEVDGLRADASYWFPGEGVARDPGHTVPPEAPRRLIETLPTRAVPLDSWMVETRWAGYEGSAALYSPGDNSIPVSGGSVGATLRQMYAIVTSTFTPWDVAMRGGSGAINRVQVDSESARRVMMDFAEYALVGGIAGAVDWQGARQVPAASYIGTTNWISATMGQVFTDLIAMNQTAAIASDDRGAGSTRMLIGTRALRALSKKNNLDAGGFGTGANVLGVFKDAATTRGQSMIEAGLDAVIGAPSLSKQGPLGASNDYDMAIMYRPSERGLRWINAMTPAPVRTVEELSGTRTLWAMVGGGLEAPDAVDVAIAFIPVTGE